MTTLPLSNEELLKFKVRRLFEILDSTEESDNGNIFHPVQVYISSVRVMRTIELNQLLKDLKELSGYIPE